MRKKITLIIAAMSAVLLTHAQNGINSPYSRYGFGIQSERAMGFNKGMGGIAQGFRDGQQVNIANPASYSAVDSTTALFDLGMSLQNSNHKMGDLQQNAKNTSFDYFAFQFRPFKNVGTTIGLMPVTNIKYSFTSSDETLSGTENTTSSYLFSGDGGLREVFLGMGWRPFKPVSIGFNASYLWGDYTHNMTMPFSESGAFSNARIYTADISTYNLQAGFQYIQPISKKDQLVLGATYTYGHKINNDAFRTTRTLNSSTVETETADTVHNAFQLPHSIAAGITYYHSNTLRIGADFELQKWGDCIFPNLSEEEIYSSTKGQLNDRTKISAGFDWTPNPSATAKLFKRCTYKAGGYYSQNYAKANFASTDKPYEFGVSAGVSIPIRNNNLWRETPKLNLSVQWAHTNIPYLNVATQRQCKLTENYLRFCIGMTFSERWFYKYKVE